MATSACDLRLLTLAFGLTVILAYAMLPRVSAAQQPQERQEAPDSLESWRRIGASVWRFDTTGVEAGPEEATAYLVSSETFGDFRIGLEFWVADATNSGVFIRCGDIRDVEDANPDNCYEINIWDNHPNQDFRTGSIVRHALPASRAESLGHWNRLQVVATGSTISVWVNDRLTAEFNDAKAPTGLVALQYAGTGLLRFRNFEIQAD